MNELWDRNSRIGSAEGWISHTTLFSGGRTLRREPGVMLRNAFRVLGRTNRVNIVMIIILSVTPVQAARAVPVLDYLRVVHQGDITERSPARAAEMCRTALPGGDGTICLPRFYPSTHYLLRFGALTSGHSSLCSRHAKHRGFSVSCGHPGAAGTHVERRVHAIMHTSRLSVTVHRHIDDGFHPNARAPRLIF